MTIFCDRILFLKDGIARETNMLNTQGSNLEFVTIGNSGENKFNNFESLKSNLTSITNTSANDNILR